MSIIVNPKVRHVLPAVLGCCIAGTVLFLSITAYSVIKYRNYVHVDAVISSVSHTNNPNKPNSSNYRTYVQYSYNYGEQAYNAERIEFLRIGKAPGKHVQIKCDPQHPEQIQDIYSMTICIFCLIILVITDFLLILMIKSCIKS